MYETTGTAGASGATGTGNGRAATRVLIVDDSRLFRAAVATVLEQRGYDVAVADDGGDALAALHAADVVLFDLELPGLDGTRLLAALSREGRLGVRAVLVLTESTDPTVEARLRALGVQQVLLKPRTDVVAACRAVETACPPGRRPVAA